MIERCIILITLTGHLKQNLSKKQQELYNYTTNSTYDQHLINNEYTNTQENMTTLPKTNKGHKMDELKFINTTKANSATN